ncbi:MAG: SMI1/KNR4 family protein [Planctomycetota bacterium]|nr:SMI1/KNR4 family protein [Planctomycetota bacterium]
MITDWKKEIAVAWYVQNETAKLDIQGLWDYHLPRVAATERELTAVEAVIGHSLDPRYREFLSYANGWECFYQRVDLFGTRELCGGRLMNAAYMMLDEIEPQAFREGPLAKSELFPIAVSSVDIDMFVITRPGGAHRPGVVIWLAGQEIDRFPTFDEFFLAMVDYNRLRYERLRRESGESETFPH